MLCVKTALAFARANKRERERERTPFCCCLEGKLLRESLTEEERIFERLFSSLALVLRLRKTLIHTLVRCDGKDTAKEKAEGKTPTTTRRRRRRTEDDNKEEEKKEEQKRFRKRRSFKTSRGKDTYHRPRSSSKTTFRVNLNFVSSLVSRKTRDIFRERLN